MAAEMTKGVVIDISGNTVKLTKAIRDARQEFATLGTEVKDMEKAMETSLYHANDKLSLLASRAVEAQETIDKLTATYKLNADELHNRLDPRLVNIAANIAKMRDEQEKVERQLVNARYEYENNARSLKAIADAFREVENNAKLVDDALRSGVFTKDDAIAVLKQQIEEGNRAIEEMSDRYQYLLANGLKPTDSEMVKLASEIGKMQEKTAQAIDKVRSLTTSANEFKTAEELLIERAEKLGKDLVNSFDKADSQWKKVSSAMKSGVFTLEDAFEMLAKEIKEGTEDVEEMRKEYEALLKKGFKPSDPVMLNLASRMGQLNERMDEASAEYRELRKEVEGTTEEMQELPKPIENVTQGIDAWTVALGNLIARGLERAYEAIKSFSKAVWESGTAFEYSMASLEALYGTALEAGEIDQLADYFRELGTQSAYSATEIANAATSLALAGYSLDETKAAIEPILQLTQATGENFEDMANIVVDGLHEFGMEATEASRFADVLAKTAISTNTDVQEMGEALKYAGAVAGSFGFEIEDLATALGAMATQGVKGSMAGTALRTTITRLATNVSDARTAFESIGGAFYDAEGNARSFYDIVSDLRKGMKGLNDEERSTLLYTIGGQRAITGLSAILNMAEEDFENLRDAVADSNGVVKQISEQKLDNLSGDAKILKNNFEELKMELFDELQPTLREITQSLTNLLQDEDFQGKAKKLADTVADSLKWFLDNMPKIIDYGKVAIGLLAGTYGGVSIVKAIKNVKKARDSFYMWMATTAVLNPQLHATMVTVIELLPVLAALGAVVGVCIMSAHDAEEAFKKWDPTAKKLSDSQKDLAKSIQETTDKTQEEVNTIFDERRDIGLLLSELDKYVDANGNVKKSYEDRVDVILGKLSDATGVEYELIDGTISHYQDLKRTIKEAADEQARQALMATFMDQYTESLKQQAEAQQGFNDALMEQSAYWDRMLDIYKDDKYAKMFENTSLTQEQFLAKNRQDQLDFLKHTEAFQTDISRSYQETVDTAQSNLFTAQDNYFTALDNMNKAQEGSLADLYKMAAEGTSTVDQSMMSSAAMMQAYLEEYNTLMARYVEQVKHGNFEAASNTKLAADDIYATAKQLAKDMSSDDAKFYIGCNEDETSRQAYLAVQTVADTVNTAATTEMPTAGQNVDAGIGSGMTEGATTLNNTADEVVKGVDEIIGDTLNEENGSEHGTEYVVDGIQTSIETGTPGVVTASETLATESDSAVSGTLTYTGGGSILSNWIQGMIDTLRARMDEVTTLAAELGTKTNSALQTTTQVHSPSKFTQWIAEEQINGLVDTYHAKAAEVADSMARLGAVANQSLTASVQNNVSTRDIADSVSSAVTDSLGKLALDGNVNVNVYLEGDAKGMFKVVRTEANNFTRNKGYSPFKKR